MWAFSLVVASRGHSQVAEAGTTLWLQCASFSPPWILLLPVMDTRASIVASYGLESTGVMHGLNCPMACGILLDQGSSLHLLHGQANSPPLSHPVLG